MPIYNINGSAVAISEGGYIPNFVTVAAADSLEKDKVSADYVCDGVNDQIEIQSAIDSLTNGGTVWLANGTYNIDAFSAVNTDSLKVAIAVKQGTQKEVVIRGSNFPIRKAGGNEPVQSAILYVTSTAMNTLTGDETRVAVIGRDETTRDYPKYTLNVSNLAVWLADNQHPVICVDGKYYSAMFVENMMFFGSNQGANAPVGVIGCKAIRGLDGANFGAGYRISNCFAFGFGVAYELNGEHLIMEQCGMRFCDYGYRFGYDNASGNLHDITLINCCQEQSRHFPAFNTAYMLSAISILSFSCEHAESGTYATVSRATGDCKGGMVEYTISSTANWQNKSFRFFESATGNGEHFTCKNLLDKEIGTTEELPADPNPGNRFYDTTTGEQKMFTGTEWVTV